ASVGGGLLIGVYLSLVFLGAVYAPQLIDVPPQEMLGVIAHEAMGSLSAPVVCVAIILACLTTAVVLAALFADFLRKEVAANGISPHSAMFVTLMIAFLVSTLEFSGIARFLSPILETIYPALITLTVVNICAQVWGFKMIRWAVAITLLTKLCFF